MKLFGSNIIAQQQRPLSSIRANILTPRDHIFAVLQPLTHSQVLQSANEDAERMGMTTQSQVWEPFFALYNVNI